jgi:hypothetical protein
MPKDIVRPGRGGLTDYMDDRLGISEYDSDQMADMTEEFFQGRSSLEDGVSGQKPIDTRFENTSEDRVCCPRSDMDDPVLDVVDERPNHSGVDKPAGQDIDRYQYPHRRY